MSGSIPLGELIYIAVKPIFKIYLIIGTGFYLARKNILTVETSKNISTIAIRVLIPCLTFQKIVTNINNGLIHEIATIVFIAYFMMFSQALLIFSVGVLVGCPRYWWGGLILCGLLPNISDLPIAYLQTMETANIFSDVDLGVSFVMIYMGLQLILQFTLGSYKLIEYDFKVDLQMQLEKEAKNDNNKDLEKGIENSISTTTNSSSDKSTPNSTSIPKSSDHSILQYRPPIIENSSNDNNNNNNEGDELSISSSVITNTDNNQLKRNNTNISSKNELSKYTSRVSVLGDILQPRQEQQPEGIQDIIRVYSRYDELNDENHDIESTLEREVKEEIEIEKEEKKLGLNIFKRISIKFKQINWNEFFWTMVAIWKDSFQQPASIVLVISVTISMIPWVQALFVESTQVTLPSAPDKQPPLSFIMDYASYIGAAQVPFGLLLLGGTIGRLKIGEFPRHLLKVPISVTFLRLFIFPIIGCAFNSKVYRDGLFYQNDILYFLSNINFALPPATSLLYITAFYTPLDGKNHIQMDLLALVYIFHYIFLVICLPFTATYTMKVSLGF